MATNHADSSANSHRKDSSGGDAESSRSSPPSNEEAPPQYVAEDAAHSVAWAPSPAERLGGNTAWCAQGADALGPRQPPSYEDSRRAPLYVPSPSPSEPPPPYTISGQVLVDRRRLEDSHGNATQFQIRKCRCSVVCCLLGCASLGLLIPIAVVYVLIWFATRGMT